MEAIDAATATNRPHYEPLREKDSIRLLILYPGLPDDEISCSLLHVRFCESPRYEALSYMWGSEKDQMEILLDGNKHPIRNNLWQALKHLRSERYKRFLWADALCIDQASEEERNHQVAQMSDIYEQAMGVRVWLGLEDEDGELVKAMKRMNDSTRRRSDYEKLLELPYWSRLWIVQEIVLGRNITIQLGHHTKTWVAFSKTICQDYNMVDADSSDDETARTISPAVSICFTRDIRWKESEVKTHSLLSLMERYQYAKCCDARDKVFGVHKFALPCCRVAVPVNYSLDNQRLFEKVMQHHYLHHSTTNHGTKNSQLKFFLDIGELFRLLKSSSELTTSHKDLIKRLGPSFRLSVWGGQVSKVILTAKYYTSSPKLFLGMAQKYSTMDSDSDFTIDPSDIAMFREGVGGDFNVSSLSNYHILHALWNIRDKLKPILAQNFMDDSRLEDAVEFIMQDRLEEWVVYYGENQQAGFATFGTKPGDMICQIGIEEISTAVIRLGDWNGNRLIGRAVSLAPTKWFHKSKVIELSLTIEEMQMLGRLWPSP